MKPTNGTVLNGAFWLNDSFWVIEQPNKSLRENLVESLQNSREYIDRLTKRANDLEKWLAESTNSNKGE
jgi:hypothetical protein